MTAPRSPQPNPTPDDDERENDDAELRSLLEDWVTRTNPWTAAPGMTAADGYAAATEQIITILNATRNDE